MNEPYMGEKLIIRGLEYEFLKFSKWERKSANKVNKLANLTTMPNVLEFLNPKILDFLTTLYCSTYFNFFIRLLLCSAPPPHLSWPLRTF